MAAATLQQTSADLKKSRAVLHHLSDTFQSIQSHLYSIMALSDQWGTFQNSFVSVQQSLGSHIRELETKERETNSLRIALDNREKEVELRRKKLDFDEKSLSEECTALEMKERDYSERIEILELEKKRVTEWFKAAEAKARRVEERNVAVERREKEVEAKERREGCKDVEEREKRVEERWRAVELREKEVDQRSEAVEVGENGINKRCIEMERREKEVERREKEVEERCRVAGSKEEDIGRRLKELELKEKRIDERFEEVELREKGVDERFEEVGLREKGVDERFEEVGLMEKGIDERFDEVVLREKQINERFEEVKLREKGIDEVCKVQELKEKELSEQGKGLELKEKGIMERLVEMELKKKEIELREAEIDQCCKAQDLRDKQLNEKCIELELKQKNINERLGELELKEKEIGERCSVVESKEKAIEEHCKAVESREREIDERFKGQELREKQLNKRCKGLELKEKRIDGRLKELELKENQLESKLKKNEETCEELELKEKRILEHSEEIRLKDKQISENFGSLELKEKHINESFKSLDSKVERLNNQSKDLALREKAVSDRSKALDLKEKKINEQSRALELKEKEINKPSKEEELGESQRDVHINALILKAKKINKCFQEQECKKNGINDPCAKLELKGKRLSDTSGMETQSKPNSSLGIGKGLQGRSLKQCVNDGKALQMFLNERVDEHRFMEEEVRDALSLSPDPGRLVLAALVGFFSPHLKNGDMMYETSAVRSSCVLLLEQLMNLKYQVDDCLKKDAKQVYFLWKERMREDGESRIVVLSILLLIVTFRLSSIIAWDELQRLYKIVDQDRIAPQLSLELDFLEGTAGSNMATGNLQVMTKQQQSDKLQGTDAVVSSSINHCSEIHSLCRRMHANGLRLYIRQLLIEETFSPEKILDALRCAPDPAKLLLNIVLIFNQPKATPVEKSNCIFLLEQLMKLQKEQPSINSLGQVEQLVKPQSKFTPGLTKKAKKFAYSWKQTLVKNGYKILEVYGFLQFLVTYEIASLFNEDELFRLFKKCYSGKLVFRPEQNPYLCRALGLEKRISGFIKSLVNEDRRLQAVKYICTFKMETYFPLVPLLKDHLKFTKEKSVKLRRKKSHAAKVQSACFEMRNLQDVLKYINDYELQSEFTDFSLELRIKELEKKIDELKTSTTKVEQKVANERNEGLKDDISINLEMEMVENNSTQLVKKAEKNLLPPANTASEFFGGKKRTSSSSPSFVLPQEKRLRAGALESSVQPGPCTSRQQVTSPAINGSSSQSGFPDNSYGASSTPTPYRETEQIAPAAGICPGGIKAELQTTTARVEQKLSTERKADLRDTLSTNIEKHIVENNSTHPVKKAENLLSPASSVTVAGSFGGKFSSSPSSSSVLPQQENHLRPHTLESPNPPNTPITTYSTSMNPPLPSLQPWGQQRPYTYGHVNALHPGQMPSVNGHSGSYGAPSGSYGAPSGSYGAPSGSYGAPSGSYGAPNCNYGASNGSYGVPNGSYGAPNGSYGGRGTGEFRPTAGIGPGSTPAPGQFVPNAGFGPGSTPAPGQFRPTAEISPGSTHAPGHFRPTVGIGPGGTPTPGQWPTAGIGPGSTPGEFRPTSGIDPGNTAGQFRPTARIGRDGAPAPGQFWPTTGSGSGGSPATGQFWHNAGIGFGSTPAPGYSVGNHMPPYRP